MADKLPTEGYTLSELPTLPLPFVPSDMVEAIRPRKNNPERYKNHHFNPDPYSIPLATTEKVGSFILRQNNVVSDMVLAAINDMLENKISAGANITTSYNDVTGILTISAGVEPPEPLEGKFNIIGRIGSRDATFVSTAGEYRAVCPLFDPVTQTIPTVYQRDCVYLAGVELDQLSIMAILGDFAVCMELQNFSTDSPRIVITHYETDENIKPLEDWVDSHVTTAPIVLDPDYYASDVVVCGAGKVAVVAGGSSQPTTKMQFVTFTQVDNAVLHNVNINLADYGINAQFTGTEPRIAADPATGLLCAVYPGVFLDEDGFGCWIRALIDSNTYEVLGAEVFTNDYTVSPLSGLTDPGQDILEFKQTSFYYKTASFSCSGVQDGGSWTSYGSNIEYNLYEARTVNINNEAEFTEPGDHISLLANALFDAKLTALGFVAADPEIGLTGGFGSIGVYVS